MSTLSEFPCLCVIPSDSLLPSAFSTYITTPTYTCKHLYTSSPPTNTRRSCLFPLLHSLNLEPSKHHAPSISKMHPPNTQRSKIKPKPKPKPGKADKISKADTTWPHDRKKKGSLNVAAFHPRVTSLTLQELFDQWLEIHDALGTKPPHAGCYVGPAGLRTRHLTRVSTGLLLKTCCGLSDM